MAVICELKSCPEEEDLREEDVSREYVEFESSDSDDSNEDPTFDIFEETRSKMSRLSVKKSSPRERSCEPIDTESEKPTDVQIPELNEKDGKCFEMVEKLIKDGKLDKLKVDQCKVYLRKYGLRLSGNKGVLIGRIKEHLEIIDGGGKKKYPPTSFVLNCKGDACTGDVVMFEQNVYEMFSIVSRSATAPPCGTRVVVGRIVKESYGAAKQQHTFTIEVLWSKGEKPLPPLHPLLIKGRNLYRLKTMRQRWVDEEERQKILQEKHSRGFVARCSRENRIHGKEIKKMARNERMKENNREQILSDQRNQYQMNQSNHRQQQEKPVSDQRSQYQMTQSNHRQQQEKPVSDQRSQYQFRHQHHKQHQLELQHHLNPIQRDVLINRDINHQLLINHMQLQHHPSILSENSLQMQQRHKLQVHNSIPQVEKPQLLAKPLYYQQLKARAIQSQPLSSLNSYRVLPQHHQQPMQQPPCRFYPEGKCYFGGKCKYLHESR